MNRFNRAKSKLSYSWLEKLKLGTKSETRVTLTLSSNIIGISNDKTIFPHKPLLTDRRVPEVCKVLANNSSFNTRLFW